MTIKLIRRVIEGKEGLFAVSRENDLDVGFYIEDAERANPCYLVTDFEERVLGFGKEIGEAYVLANELLKGEFQKRSIEDSIVIPDPNLELMLKTSYREVLGGKNES